MAQPGGPGTARPLLFLLECPECGAPLAADDEIVSTRCEHCGSRLLFSAPGRAELYFTDGVLTDRDHLLETVILYKVQALLSEIMAEYRDADGVSHPPPPFLIERRLKAYENALRGAARVVEAHRFFAPYWHISGRIVQGVLGRHGDGPKEVRVRAFAVSHTAPAYDETVANLRDRGLRLMATRVRPLRMKDKPDGTFLPWLDTVDAHYREIDKWKTRDLIPGVEPVTKHGLFVARRRALVYRPYWLARIMTDKGEESLLLDGSFDTIAGHPPWDEAVSILERAIPDPLHSDQESYRHVQVIPSRCPDCGFEQPLEAHHLIVICPNCHLALHLDPKGVVTTHYAHAPSGVGAGLSYVPFWRFEFEARLTGAAEPATTLEDYGRLLFPQGPPPHFDPKGKHLWLPAFRLLGTPLGDEAFQGLAHWIHRTPLDVQEGKIPLDSSPEMWAVSVPEGEARETASFVLLGLYDKVSAARLNGILVRRAIADAILSLAAPALVWIPFVGTQGLLIHEGGGVAFPRMLLTAGPDLEAQRVTVDSPAGMGHEGD